MYAGKSFDSVCSVPTHETYSAQDDQYLLTPIHSPVSLAVEAELQQAVLGIVSLAALGTLQIAAPRRALAIVVLGDCESCAATAGHKVKFQVGI